MRTARVAKRLNNTINVETEVKNYRKRKRMVKLPVINYSTDSGLCRGAVYYSSF